MADDALSARELVERAQQGDVNAFGELYDRYTQVVFRFVLSRVGNYALAEDITSDTFVRAWRRLETFTWQGRDVGGWLITIARNLVADHFASAGYRREVATEDVLTSAPTELVDGPEDIVVRNADRDRVLTPCPTSAMSSARAWRPGSSRACRWPRRRSCWAAMTEPSEPCSTGRCARWRTSCRGNTRPDRGAPPAGRRQSLGTTRSTRSSAVT